VQLHSALLSEHMMGTKNLAGDGDVAQ
jgi:hypothetical protein